MKNIFAIIFIFLSITARADVVEKKYELVIGENKNKEKIIFFINRFCNKNKYLCSDRLIDLRRIKNNNVVIQIIKDLKTIAIISNMPSGKYAIHFYDNDEKIDNIVQDFISMYYNEFGIKLYLNENEQ